MWFEKEVTPLHLRQGTDEGDEDYTRCEDTKLHTTELDRETLAWILTPK